MNEQRRLSLIVGAARSGTTLLRVLLDAHPEITAPSEAALPALAQSLMMTWGVVSADGNESLLGDAQLPTIAREAMRTALDAPITFCCERDRATVYCDKSLDSVRYLPAIRLAYPSARYVLAFRHVMDAIASGLEASPWGFAQYGYGPYLAKHSDNFVTGLAAYWSDHVARALRWEERHRDQCVRVRYEDLVTDPQASLARVFSFLGVDPSIAVATTAFERARRSTGPGDYKIGYTSAIHNKSVGRGRRVPVDFLPDTLLRSVNDQLEQLGYERLDASWNLGPTEDQGDHPSSLIEFMRTIELNPPSEHLLGMDIAVIADDAPDARWIVCCSDGSIAMRDGEVDYIITGSAGDLMEALTDPDAAPRLLRTGRVRYLSSAGHAMPTEKASSDVREFVRWFQLRAS